MNTRPCQFWGYWRRKTYTSWFQRLAVCMSSRVRLHYWKSSPRLSRLSFVSRRPSGKFFWSKSATKVVRVEVPCWQFLCPAAWWRFSRLLVHCRTWRSSSSGRSWWLAFWEQVISCTRRSDQSPWIQNVSQKGCFKFSMPRDSIKFSSLHTQPEDSSQSYSRLDTNAKSKPSITKRTSMWFLNKAVPSLSTHSIAKRAKGAQKEEMEKEWLLLGEPSSPVNRSDQDPSNDVNESSILSDVTASDTECIVKAENSDTDSEEDIDSIVEEFQQKVKVSTAGLKETNLKIPSMGSWRLAMPCMFSVVGSCVLAGFSASFELLIPFTLSVAGNVQTVSLGFVTNDYSLQWFSWWASSWCGYRATRIPTIRQKSSRARSRFCSIASFFRRWCSTVGLRLSSGFSPESFSLCSRLWNAMCGVVYAWTIRDIPASQRCWWKRVCFRTARRGSQPQRFAWRIRQWARQW